MLVRNSMNSCFFVTSKKETAMKVLWALDGPLNTTEIAEKSSNKSWPLNSIQNVLGTLEKKKVVEVAEITKVGKYYGRLFRSTISANEYAVMQFNRYYQEDLSFISMLLSKNSCKEKVAEAL